ncbi:MAG: protein L [Arenimonas sp.]
MAQYKHGEHLQHSDNTAYDTRHTPGTEAANAGIYRCVACGDEIGIAKGHTWPPQNHHQHAPGTGRIEWQLLVFAQSKA